jgi:hypothetical protein
MIKFHPENFDEFGDLVKDTITFKDGYLNSI